MTLWDLLLRRCTALALGPAVWEVKVPDAARIGVSPPWVPERLPSSDSCLHLRWLTHELQLDLPFGSSFRDKTECRPS